MTKLAKTFSAPRYNTLIGIVLACVMGVLTYFGLFYQQKLLLKIIQFKALMSLTIKKISTGKNITQKFQFVYLKATEGGDYKDPKFQENWLKAREHGFHVGAYHFYRLCRDGKTQAENFISTVPNKADALPPVIDLEYDSNCINSHTKEQLLKEIGIMHDSLKHHYGKQPIFYISKTFITLY